jgi:translation initiation factor IF-3
VRLIGAEGEQVGVVSLASAMSMAEAAETDLVEIAPTASPPVCRLMDYGKFKYRESKKQHEAKLKQKVIEVKEVKFRPGTDENDYQIKLRNLIKFLDQGDKTKITLRFRGREMAHQEFGFQLLKRVEADLLTHGVVEQFPKMEGRQMVMVLAPKKALIPAKPVKEAKAPSNEGAASAKQNSGGAAKPVAAKPSAPANDADADAAAGAKPAPAAEQSPTAAAK